MYGRYFPLNKIKLPISLEDQKLSYFMKWREKNWLLAEFLWTFLGRVIQRLSSLDKAPGVLDQALQWL